MIKLFLNFLIIFFLVQNLNSEEIYGTPKIIDGDTVHINSKKIRLEGIDAPEMRQQCQKMFLEVSAIIGFNLKKDYACGVISKEKLIDKINKSQIKCVSLGRDRYKRYLATCYKDRTNLNKWMVRNGLAVAYKRYSKDYLRDEIYAKKKQTWSVEGIFYKARKMEKA